MRLVHLRNMCVCNNDEPIVGMHSRRSEFQGRPRTVVEGTMRAVTPSRGVRLLCVLAALRVAAGGCAFWCPGNSKTWEVKCKYRGCSTCRECSADSSPLDVNTALPPHRGSPVNLIIDTDLSIDVRNALFNQLPRQPFSLPPHPTMLGRRCRRPLRGARPR